jgi:predicted DNA-binding transcriptional regulator AlpA
MESFVTAPIVAQHVGVSTSLVRKWTRRADTPVPHHRLPGGRGIRYLISEIDQWMTVTQAPD